MDIILSRNISRAAHATGRKPGKRTDNPLTLPVKIASFGLLLLTGRITAQTFTVLHAFTGGTEGGPPNANLLLSGNTLYGTTAGVSGGWGTVFAIDTDGTGFTNLYAFSALDTSTWPPVNSDGAVPVNCAGLVLSGPTLYGATSRGGPFGAGTVFAVGTDGTGFANLYSFPSTDLGGFPVSALVPSGDGVYGVVGGQSGLGQGTAFSKNGMVFKVNPDGTGLTTVYSFTAAVGYTNGLPINSDGISPITLILSGTTLYGTTWYGGTGGNGTVFAVNTDGKGFTALHTFTASPNTNYDGAGPVGLVLSGSALYGTTALGGAYNNGTVFKVNTDGTGFTTLHSFLRSIDGFYPVGALFLSGNTLYGAMHEGGSSENGTVFAVNIDGTGFTTLHNFSATANGQAPANPDGAEPLGGLVLSGSNLYGTAYLGGTFGYGTVFSISLPVPPPQLTITPGLGNIVLTWSTNATGFTLQSTTNLGSSAVWTTVSPAPVTVNGQNTVTSPISGIQQFYRLSQ